MRSNKILWNRKISLQRGRIGFNRRRADGHVNGTTVLPDRRITTLRISTNIKPQHQRSQDSSVEFPMPRTPDCRVEPSRVGTSFLKFQTSRASSVAGALSETSASPCLRRILVGYVLRQQVACLTIVAKLAIVADPPMQSPFWRSSPIARCTCAGPGRHESQT